MDSVIQPTLSLDAVRESIAWSPQITVRKASEEVVLALGRRLRPSYDSGSTRRRRTRDAVTVVRIGGGREGSQRWINLHMAPRGNRWSIRRGVGRRIERIGSRILASESRCCILAAPTGCQESADEQANRRRCGMFHEPERYQRAAARSNPRGSPDYLKNPHKLGPLAFWRRVVLELSTDPRHHAPVLAFRLNGDGIKVSSLGLACFTMSHLPA